VLLALAGALAKAAPAAEGTAFLIAFVAGIVLVSWQVTQIKHRWFREAVFPTLLPALRPLKPSPQEIEDILGDLKRRGERIGKKLDPQRLIAALAAVPTPLAAATIAPPPVSGPVRTPAAAPSPPHRVPEPVLTPVTLAAPEVARPAPAAKPPGLKLKYGGIRHRVTAADGEIMIGRAPDANIVVSEQHVSRHHASIIWDDYGNPLLVNLSQIGTSVQVDGQPSPERVETSIRLKGQGRIGLSGEFAYAEEHQIVVAYEVKGGPAA